MLCFLLSCHLLATSYRWTRSCTRAFATLLTLLRKAQVLLAALASIQNIMHLSLNALTITPIVHLFEQALPHPVVKVTCLSALDESSHFHLAFVHVFFTK